MADGSAPDRSRHRNSHDGLIIRINTGTRYGDDLPLASVYGGQHTTHEIYRMLRDLTIRLGRENLMDILRLRNPRSNQLIHQVMLGIMVLILMSILDYNISSFMLVVLSTVGILAILLSMLLHNRMPRTAGNLSRLGVVAGSSAVLLATGMVLPMRDIWVIVLLCIINAAAILFGHINNIGGTNDGRVGTSPPFPVLSNEFFGPLGVDAVATNIENERIGREVHVYLNFNQIINEDNRRLYNTNGEGSHLSNRVSNQEIDPVMPEITAVQNNLRNRETNQLIDQVILTISGPTSLLLMLLIMEHPTSHFPPLLYFVGAANIVGFIATLISVLLRNRMPLAAGYLSRLGTAAGSSTVVMAMGLVAPRFIWAFVLLSIITVAAVLFGQTTHGD